MKNIDRNLEILVEFITDYNQEKGYLPSIREMAAHLNIKSTSTINYYINILEKRNILKRNSDNRARAFEIISRKTPKFEPYQSGMINIPLVGNVTAGEPILAVENYENIYTFPVSLFNNTDLFMLTVEGESMINAGINDGDYVVVHKQSYATNGEIVVAMIDYHATIKRFYKENNRFRLQPENDLMSPIYSQDVEILGKVVGLIRKMR